MSIFRTSIAGLFLLISTSLLSQDTVSLENTRFKLDGTFAFNYTGSLGYYWNLNKNRDVNKSQFYLGFRLETFVSQIWLLGPSLDYHKIIGNGKINPIYGLQVGGGLAGFAELEISEVFINISPYAGVNVNTRDDFQFDITFQLRHNLTPFVAHIVPSIGAAFRF